MGIWIVKVERKRDRHIHIQLHADAVIVLMIVEFNAGVLWCSTVMVVCLIMVMMMIMTVLMQMVMQMIMRNGLAKRMQFIWHGRRLDGAERQ